MYHDDPDVLILDEATSALDNITERAIMENIILIAHRLSTVRRCDQIYLLEHGRLLAQGTYSELLAEWECGKKDERLFKKAMRILIKVIRKIDALTLLTDGERRCGNILFETCYELSKTVHNVHYMARKY
jgi:ABC-type multidrug transport system ATPase subunit